MTADANRAASQECMERAREAIRAGDADKARRMLEKAKRLNPEQDVEYLLQKVEAINNNESESSSRGGDSTEDRSYAHDDHYEEPSLRSRKPHKSPQRNNAKVSAKLTTPASDVQGSSRQRSASRTPKLGVDYTKEQADQVERIRHCKDYYEILKLPKTASDSDIKKEYRKIALQLHPDKCRAPHSTEAFKALGNAYAVLSDEEKRKQYDTYGPMEGQQQQTRSRRRGDFFEYDYGHGFESDFTPEEIFNMFFGGGYPSEQIHRRRQRYHQHQQHQEHHQNENPFSALLQLAPLIAILVLGLLAQLMVGDPAFSHHRTEKYTVQRYTRELRVPYYVRPDFEDSYRNRIRQVENQVEDEYVQNLRMNCYKEQNQRETLIYRARWMRDEELIRKAERTPMPNCDRLKEIFAR